MALSPRFSLLHSDLNDFLFASVGEEQNGVTLTVVSGFDAARPGSLGRGRPAHSIAKAYGSRRARQADCSVAHLPSAIIGRLGHQPTIGRAFAGTDGAFADSERDMVGAKESLVGTDTFRQPCPCYRDPRQHLVIGTW